MVVEHAHGLRQRRGPNAKSSLHKAHLAPDAGLQAPGASLSFAQGSHDFESLDRGIGRGDRFETAHRLDQYLELSVIGLDHVIEIYFTCRWAVSRSSFPSRFNSVIAAP